MYLITLPEYPVALPINIFRIELLLLYSFVLHTNQIYSITLDLQQQNQLQQNNTGAKSGFPSRYHSARVSFSRDDTIALDVRRKSAISRLCSGGNYGSDRGADGTLLLR